MSPLPAEVLALFTELGPGTPCIEGVTFLEEDRAWVVSIDDDDMALLIEWDDDPARLAFTTLLSRPPPEQQARVHEALLGYNALWRDTGGVRMGLSSDSRELLMMREVPAHALTLDSLRETLLEFAASGRVWRRYVANPIAHEPASPISFDFLALRV